MKMKDVIAILIVIGVAIVISSNNNKSDVKKYVVRYFDIKGRAEAIRLCLADIDVDFEDEAFSGEEWRGGLKERWSEEGLLPFGQVPLVERVGGGSDGSPRSMVQSQAILRWIGRHHNIYGNHGSANALVDLISDGTEDVRKRLMKAVYATEEKEEKMAKYFSEDAPLWLSYFESIAARPCKSLTKSVEDPWIACTSIPTMADYLLYDLIDTHEERGDRDQTRKILKQSKHLSLWRDRMSNRENIKRYLASEKRRK
jgi:glutathione S-transferase